MTADVKCAENLSFYLTDGDMSRFIISSLLGNHIMA